MTGHPTDTIFALASGAGKAALAVIRISGPRTRFVLETMAGTVTQPRRMSRRTLRDGTGAPLDDALVVFFPGPASFTGEDSAELHLHGGRAVIERALASLGALVGCRLAEPGEFTRRAFLNGKLDGTEVEALADLIDAETTGQAAQALAQLRGALSTAISDLRSRLLHAMALLEAGLDFADEGDVEPDTLPVREALGDVAGLIDALLADAGRGEKVREGVNVVILGRPNAGKSTLLNALARRDVAIVTDTPGTTRDLLEVRLELAGVPVTLVDTAGLHETSDPVEREGIRRALVRAERADLVIWLASTGDEPPPSVNAPLLSVQSKVDSTPDRFGCSLEISARTGEGMDALLGELERCVRDRFGGETAVVTRERHRLALEAAKRRVESAIEGLDEGRLPELVSEDMRLATREVERILGRVDVEQMLDTLFSGFCIGK
ncbi:tRNA uridine-5-carboxymethylaminomethyl(34) synthesis GTPase MnmE [Alsobacter sp. SYSU M60028]|uniref:tRNA modification GTPase MnmE n=1 Tax=Alsobacter ponti TaxID=2962936 RepID=A0ABT1LAZ5_9HYPH|nr:tRNA uridine-5-carboxymethylaminomethyl(34) synthesis GTPase MnmE [Alsobacter ponti]MCP8938656.1 tRNA uridine-5-carboxymethylaminomethyl(34) synthesis GTPase MnmE [Alsobacter ponti]